MLHVAERPAIGRGSHVLDDRLTIHVGCVEVHLSIVEDRSFGIDHDTFLLEMTVNANAPNDRTLKLKQALYILLSRLLAVNSLLSCNMSFIMAMADESELTAGHLLLRGGCDSAIPGLR